MPLSKAIELESFSFANALGPVPEVTQAPSAMTPAYSLDQLPTGHAATVTTLKPPAASPEWQHQLQDLGFVSGEPVQVLRRAALGGDPLVVRVGTSTYALRRAEAACVRVLPAHRPAA